MAARPDGSPQTDRKKVVVARQLLPAGMELLEGRFEVLEGGLDCDRERLFEIVPGAAAIIADPTVVVGSDLLDAAGPSLELVANFAVGYDNLDLAACRARGIAATNTPDVLTNATAELAVALTFAAARQLPAAERQLRAGGWTGWNPSEFRGIELSRACIGVLGMGRIGTRYAELMAGLGGELLYWSRSPGSGTGRDLNATYTELPELLRRADVVSIHLPASSETANLIDAEAVRSMKRDAILINTSRGSLVDATAVADALRDGRLGAVGLDVFENEPQVPTELLEAPRAVLTPHIGSATFSSRDAMARLAAENVVAVLNGRDPITAVG
jgi:glyoxylate reductase